MPRCQQNTSFQLLEQCIMEIWELQQVKQVIHNLWPFYVFCFYHSLTIFPQILKFANSWRNNKTKNKWNKHSQISVHSWLKASRWSYLPCPSDELHTCRYVCICILIRIETSEFKHVSVNNFGPTKVTYRY